MLNFIGINLVFFVMTYEEADTIMPTSFKQCIDIGIVTGWFLIELVTYCGFIGFVDSNSQGKVHTITVFAWRIWAKQLKS
jgi:hypothetical protein